MHRPLAATVALLAVARLASGAVVLCAKPRHDGSFSTTVKIRTGACRPNEQQLDPGPIGLQGPKGDPGTAERPLSLWVDNGDGTVSDSATGLHWEQKVNGAGIHSVNNQYTWSNVANGDENPDGTVFTVFLATLNTPPCFANHCDWRLPTVAEARSILREPYQPCAHSPCIAPVFGATDDMLTSTVENHPNYVWTVGERGSVTETHKLGEGRVRAVRTAN